MVLSANAHSPAACDIEKMDDVQRLRVEDETSRVVRGRHTQLFRACDMKGVSVDEAFKELFGMLVRKFAGVGR